MQINRTLRKFIVASIFITLSTTAGLAESNSWRTLTPPAPLPKSEKSGKVNVNNVSIHYMIFGSNNAKVVVLLHGGLGAAEDFGSQVTALAEKYKVIAIDSRGHGRSTYNDVPFSYHLMASDVLGVMDHLSIDKFAVVGWSDGGNIGIDLAIHNSDRLTKVFALGANYKTEGVMPTVHHDAMIGLYVGYTADQYGRLSGTPDKFKEFSEKVFAMWGKEPTFTEEQLKGISTPFMVAAGVYEEAIFRTHTEKMAGLIPGAKLLIIGNASHFAHWQRPAEVNKAILDFLSE